VVGLGVDVVDVRRFAATLERTPGIVARVFTEAEIAAAGGHRLRTVSLAGRWAVKEAVAKVLVDTRGMHWHDCQVLTGDHGEPVIEVSGSVAEASRARGIDRWLVSLSHDGDMAIAVVIAGARSVRSAPEGDAARSVRSAPEGDAARSVRSAPEGDGARSVRELS